MLWNLCVFALLAAQALSTSRYFVGTFQTSYTWAYPIDICSPTGIGSAYVKYTCAPNGTMVEQQAFSDSACSSSVLSTKYFDASSMESNGLYGFYCNGTNDFVKSKLYVSSCSSPTTLTVYSAINTCFQYSAYNNSYALFEQTQCNASMSQIGIYAAPDAICDASYAYVFLEGTSSVTTTCELYITSPLATVYAKLLDCVYDGYSNFPQMWNNSGSIQSTKPGLVGVELLINAWAYDDLYDDPMVCGLDWFGWLTAYFTGSMVKTTTICNSYEGSGYPSILIDSDITFYNASWVQTCSMIEANLQAGLVNLTNSTNIELSFNCTEYNISSPTTTKKSPGAMVSINYLIVFAISCFVMVMYI